MVSHENFRNLLIAYFKRTINSNDILNIPELPVISIVLFTLLLFLLHYNSVRPILDAVLKQVYFSTAWFGLASLCFRRRKYSRAEIALFMISNQR